MIFEEENSIDFIGTNGASSGAGEGDGGHRLLSFREYGCGRGDGEGGLEGNGYGSTIIFIDDHGCGLADGSGNVDGSGVGFIPNDFRAQINSDRINDN